MGSAVGSLRDPIFYRWHTCLEEIFREYKDTLGTYADEDLNFDGIEVKEVKIQTDRISEDNTILTFMEFEEIQLRNIDGDLHYEYDKDKLKKTINEQRLNHHHFKYHLKIESDTETEGIVRIFLKPFGVNGNRGIFEMDHFYIKLKTGHNVIKRDEASAPHLSKSNMTLSDLQDQLMNGKLRKDQFDWAGCGWPVNLNIPRGKEGGMKWQLVVMVSSILQDKEGNMKDKWESAKSYSWPYCGIQKGSFPDNRPLGFPFDRNFLKLSSLMKNSSSLKKRSNWALIDVTIKHLEM